MNTNATLEKMHQMKFYGMARTYQALLTGKDHTQMTHDSLIAQLVESEWLDREDRKTSRYIRAARFRYPASIEQVDYYTSRNLDKNQLLRLSEGKYIRGKENLIITGPTGVGKSYIASALGHQACQQGFNVRYFHLNKLFSWMNMSRADNSYLKEMNKLEKTNLLILDDFGLQPIQGDNRNLLLEVMEDRYDRQSTIIASQIPVEQWYDMFDDNTIADAILDRLIHRSHRIVLKGESMRKVNSMNLKTDNN
jgi:DNA replication protein DnaC